MSTTTQAPSPAALRDPYNPSAPYVGPRCGPGCPASVNRPAPCDGCPGPHPGPSWAVLSERNRVKARHPITCVCPTCHDRFMADLRRREAEACERLLDRCPPLHDNDWPLPEWAQPIACFLAGEGYSARSIDAVVDHGARRKSFECAGSLFDTDADRAECERLIPRDPRWDSPEWDQITFGITEA